MDEATRQTVEQEVRVAFEAYERALVANDVDGLIEAFDDDPRTLRMTTDSGLFGADEIAAFRRNRDASDVARTLTRVEIVAITETVAVVGATYTRTASGRKGAQSQVWHRRRAGWRIMAAHVSVGR